MQVTTPGGQRGAQGARLSWRLPTRRAHRARPRQGQEGVELRRDAPARLDPLGRMEPLRPLQDGIVVVASVLNLDAVTGPHLPARPVVAPPSLGHQVGQVRAVGAPAAMPRDPQASVRIRGGNVLLTVFYLARREDQPAHRRDVLEHEQQPLANSPLLTRRERIPGAKARAERPAEVEVRAQARASRRVRFQGVAGHVLPAAE